MAITIKPANLYKPLKSHSFMKSVASGGIARFVALEAVVETGRTYQAAKRGGFDEGRERITEEFTGAVFWLGGVKAFNAINDRIGKAILKLRTAKFDLGKDNARDTVKNFIYSERDTVKGLPFTKQQIATFKASKLIASILMANAMIGFVVPKINQSITKYYHRNDKSIPVNEQQNIPENNTLNQKQSSNNTMIISGLDKFKENSAKIDNSQKHITGFGNKISFGGGVDKLMSLAFNLENNTTWQLLSTDVGTAGGRALSARNNDERREILFRDLSSIYFYMFNMPFMNSLLNRFEHGKKTRIEPMNAHYTTDLMKQIVKENGTSIDADKFSIEMFGKNSDFKLPESIKSEFTNGSMDIETFKQKIASIPEASTPELVSKYTRIAEDMAKLQPPIEGKNIITLEQAERVFKGGYLNNPEFLKNLYEIAFGTEKPSGNIFKKLFGKPAPAGEAVPNFLNPYKFISSKDIEAVDSDLKFYIEKIIKKAKDSGKQITEEMLERASKSNARFNMLNWGAGYVISALFLSTIIPKIQYWMTKRITGSDNFPGTEEYRKQQNQADKSQTKAAE